MTTSATADSALGGEPAIPGARRGRAHDGRTVFGQDGLTVALLALAALIGVIGPLILAARTGSISIPHNDAWSYSRSAQIFARTGHIELFNWDAMAVVGAFLPLGPLLGSITVQSCYIAVLALLSLAACFDLLRPYVGGRKAAVAVLIVTIWPGFGLISTSFMTDIPSFAASTIALAIGRRAVERRSFPLFALCMLVGVWGVTVREQTVAAPIAVLGAALLRRELRTRAMILKLLALGVLEAAAAGAFELWRRGLPGGSAPSLLHLGYPGTHSVFYTCVSAVLLLGLMLSPLLVVAARPLRWSWAARIVAVLTFVVVLAAVERHGVGFPQNYLTIGGSYPGAAIGSRPDVIPLAAWDVLEPIGCVGAGLLAGVLVSRFRLWRPDLWMFAFLTALGTLAETMEGELLFDRFLLPLALCLAPLLLLDRESKREPEVRPETRQGLARAFGTARTSFAVAVGVFLAGVVSLLTANALTFDAAVWHTAQGVVASGEATPQYVDAGLAWTGYYSPYGMQNTIDPNAEPGVYSKTRQLTDDHPCYIIDAQRKTTFDWTLENTTWYRKYGLFGKSASIYVFRTPEVDCH